MQFKNLIKNWTMPFFKYFIFMISDFGNSLIKISTNHYSWFSLIIFSIASYAFGGWEYLKNQWAPLDLLYICFAIVCFIAGFNTVAKKYQEIDDLKQQTADKENKERFVADIRPIMDQASLSNPMNKGAPLYNEALKILENNSAVSKIWIDIFKNDESLRERFDSLYEPSKLRIRLLNHLIQSFLPE